jgi:phosphatidylserine/phosphatidylglycerophosphate/cardiolipin synthase-like enzyme
MKNKRFNWRRIAAYILVLMVIVFFGDELLPADDGTAPSDPSTPASTPPTPAPVVRDQTVTLYLTTPFLVYPDVRDNRQAPPGYQTLLADVTAATRSIDVAVFDIDLPELGEALVAAAQRGVQVRVAFDDENLEDARVAALIGSLEDAGIATRGDGREPFMHEKVVVVDERIVWTGSWNLTMNDTYRNNNNFLRIVNPTMAQAYTTEVDQLMNDQFGNNKQSNAPHPVIALNDGSFQFFFAPVDDINVHVVDAIAQAKSSVHFMAFSYTDDAIAAAMIEAHQRGVQVEGVFERQNAKGTGAEYENLRDAGIPVEVDGNCYIMHHKTMIIDNRYVITGSYNFTKSAEQSNDENLLLIDSPALAAEYQAEYARIKEQALAPLTCGS